MIDQKKKSILFSEFGGQNPSFFQTEEEIIAKLKQISSSTKSPQDIGRALEDYFSSLLRGLLPIGYRVETRCKVIDKKGNSSRVIDLAIVDSRFPTLYRASDGSSLLMHESVVKVFELKSSLDSKEISDIFAKVYDWIEFKVITENIKGKRGINRVMNYFAREFVTLCVESKIGLKTIIKKLDGESQKYNGAINGTLVFILRIKENTKIKYRITPPIGLYCWWENLKDLSFTQTIAPLSDLIYELHQDLSGERIRETIHKYFKWGTVWSQTIIKKLIKPSKR